MFNSLAELTLLIIIIVPTSALWVSVMMED